VAAPSARDAEEICRQVRCPVLVVHGDQDGIVPYETGRAVAGWTGGDLVAMAGVGHAPTLREPVRTNLLIREFAERFADAPAGPRRWTRSLDRPRRVLMVCSPIGLGHVRRDLAIAAELRAQRPGVRIDWLAQSPVAGAVAARGERVHPASRWPASESAHIEAEAGEHNLRVFEAIRRMDEILVPNFMTFHDVARDEPYDLWVADEGWEIDHFLHESPEEKSAAYAWLTDFVGWLPMPSGGVAEAALTADYNAEMLEHLARLLCVCTSRRTASRHGASRSGAGRGTRGPARTAWTFPAPRRRSRTGPDRKQTGVPLPRYRVSPGRRGFV
jgi:hypothetical protein